MRAPARSRGTSRSPIRTQGFTNSSGPIVARGKVIQGLHGCDRFRAKERCFISAYDAETGKQLWKFHTIARTGEPGGDTWGTVPDVARAGGDTWIAGSYDPDLDLTYWGIAQAKPWMPVSRGNKTSDAALYTASTVALRAERRHAGVALPARARRIARPRRSVREGARRHRSREGSLHDRQGRRSVEDRAQDRQVPRLQADRVPERVREDRSGARHRRRTARTSSTRRSTSG